MPGLFAHAIEDSTDIFEISGGFEPPKPPSVRHWVHKYHTFGAHPSSIFRSILGKQCLSF